MFWCNEITSFKLENKQNKQREGKMVFIFKKTYHLATFKGRWHKQYQSKNRPRL